MWTTIKKYRTGIIIAVLIIGLGTWSMLDQQASKPPENARQSEIKKLIPCEACTCVELVLAVKSKMNNPASFEHIETTYRDKGEYLFVSMQFRGENNFGGKVVNTAQAKVYFDGKVKDLQIF